MVAPGPGEQRRRWVQQAIAEVHERLAADGVVWVFVRPGLRRRAARCLARAGLGVVEPLLAVPAGARADHLVPLAAAPLRDAADRHLGGSWRARTTALVAGTRPGRALLRAVLPGCALVARREPGWGWLADGRPATGASVAAARGGREDAAVATVRRYRGSDQAADLVAKVALDAAGAARLERERHALRALAADAARAGAAVPALAAAAEPWLTTAPLLPGRSASAVLARRPREAGAVAAAIEDWLLAWARLTSRTGPASEGLLTEALLDPAQRVLAVRPEAADYVDAIAALKARLEGAPVVLVAVHGDLTMSNVLRDGPRLAVVDWEAATGAGLPLTDAWYAMADIAARAARTSHAEAVAALAGGDAAAAPPAGAADRLAGALGLSADQALLGFHACWLGHAANELERGRADGPFLATVGRVATARLRWPGGGDAG